MILIIFNIEYKIKLLLFINLKNNLIFFIKFRFKSFNLENLNFVKVIFIIKFYNGKSLKILNELNILQDLYGKMVIQIVLVKYKGICKIQKEFDCYVLKIDEEINLI